MIKPVTLPLLLLLASCTTVTLRPEIVGQVSDAKNKLPVAHVLIYSYDGQKLTESDAGGRFRLPPLTRTRLIIPGDEKDQLGPHAFDFVLRHKVYTSDTLTVKIENTPIQTDTIYLKPL